MSIPKEIESYKLAGCPDRHCHPGELFLQNDPDNIFPKEFYGDDTMYIRPIENTRLGLLGKRLERIVTGGLRLPTGLYEEESYIRGISDAIEKVQKGGFDYRKLCEEFGIVNIGTTGASINIQENSGEVTTRNLIINCADDIGRRSLSVIGLLPGAFLCHEQKYLVVLLMSGREREVIIMEKHGDFGHIVRHNKGMRRVLEDELYKDAPLFVVEEGPVNDY